MAKVLVVGSMNMDIVTQVQRHPIPGETIQGQATQFFVGGKGANQAVAASRSGATVAMAGGLGDDFFGQDIHHKLSVDRIDMEGVLRKSLMTGMAIITVDHLGENSIILSAGANASYSEQDVQGLELSEYDAVLLQNEIPRETNRAVLGLAKVAGTTVFANPAPVLGFEVDDLKFIDFLILNEIEAEVLSGVELDDVAKAREAAERIMEHGVQGVIITLGSKGSFYIDSSGLMISTPAYQVEVVDTTAAGDTFIGAFVSKYLTGEGVEYSLNYATAASALTVSAPGAQSSIPEEAQVLEFMGKRKSSLG
ncbi:ribokinase [Bacillus sp. FJAT-27264]|uniref:ribokinase n=1 Tax=Paenibacillus sp. (strain DSM 101736 / FJAT-27264) TaxID=1850362 RepID=UPI000807EA2B|nr:ribokinase [Bacillus sp. FJAT-27264]OBZ19308.1 ribokinase [Bacillus sp. FJAT-27264]